MGGRPRTSDERSQEVAGATRGRVRGGIGGLSVLSTALVAAALASPVYAETPPVKSYGRYCQNQSKLRVAGQKTTPFGQCVTAMAKLATHRSKDPWAACSALSRKPTKGVPGSPFSRCVVAGTRLLKDLQKP